MQFFRTPVFALWLFACANCHAELVTLSIDTAGPNASSVDILVDAGLLGDDQVTSSISGDITLDLLPSAVNPTSAQIVDFNATVDDEVDFRIGFFLTRVTVEADPGTIKLHLSEAGLPGVISNGMFTQLENLVGFEGVITASVEPEPIDLSEQEEPTPINFEDVGIMLDRTNATVNGSLITQQIIPFDAGLLELEVTLDIEGSLNASGMIPPATYSIVPPADAVTPFSDTQHWLRGDVSDTNSLPIAIDSVVFQGSAENVGTIDLDATVQSVANATSTGRVELQNGTVDVAGTLTVQENALLFLHPDTKLVAGSMNLSADSLLVMSATTTHEIEGELAIDSNISVFPPSETGSFDLFTFGELTGSYAGAPATHIENGRFGTIEVGANAIRLINTKAIAGDTDGNGQVEFADFLQLSSSFGMAGDWVFGDFDGNGIVEFADFLALSSNFGESAAASAGIAVVPEPGSTTSTALCFLILFGLRKRRSLNGRRIG